MLEREPIVLTAQKELQAGPDARIGILERLEGLTIEPPANRSGRTLRLRKGPRLEHLLPRGLASEDRVIGQDPRHRLRVPLGEHVQLLGGSLVARVETQELEEERAPLNVGRMIPHLGVQRRDRLRELPVSIQG